MKQKIIHHSVADWDFGPGMVHELTTATFVSDPSSLHLGSYPDSTPDGVILCRHAFTQCIAQGRLISWCRQRSPRNQYRFSFRNQAPLGSADEQNCYRVWVDAGHWNLDRINDGAVTSLGDQPAINLKDTWERRRITFFDGEDGEGAPALVVTFDSEVDGNWVQQGAPLYDTESHWKASEINRIGLVSFACSSGWEQWYDDTEIYERG